jgi:putative ABC transport system permease protein
MFKNYLKIGFRNLLKNKLFSMINISGMAISIACVLIIGLYIADELKFDRYVDEVDLKFRVYNEHFSEDGTTRKGAMIPPMIAPTLKSEFPEVDYHFRFLNFNSTALFEAGDKKIIETKGGYGEATMFDMFSLPLIEGNKNTALKQSNTIALSQSLARKYYGNNRCVGETIQVLGSGYKIDAVYQDFPEHSHLQINYILSMENLMQGIPERMKSWGWNQFHTYIKLKPGTNAQALESKLEGFAERFAWPTTKPDGRYYIPHLMSMDKIHLYASDQQWDIANRGNAQTIYILSATAIFILVISILNFVNLSTARAVNRVKEVGVRKVVGAFRTQLIYQFISESIIIALIALLIGGLLAELTLPMLNNFTEKHIPTGIFLDPLLLTVIVVSTLIVGVAAGAYPAFYISGYRPSQILANKQSAASGKHLLRKGLVILQFMLSFFLIIAAFVVSDQHTFLRNKNMGFNKENLVVIPLRDDSVMTLESTKNEFLKHPNVISGTLGYGLPGQAFAGDGIRDKTTGKEWGISLLTVDHDYVKTLGLNIIAGRDFSKDFPSDLDNAFIISEAGAKMLGYADPTKAIGHEVSWPRWDDPKKVKEGTIVGVVKDLHLNSLKESITPVILHVYPFAYNTLTVKIKPEDIPATISHLENTWKRFNSKWPFEYKFLDSNFDNLYKAEERLAVLFTFFTGFTIFVACLGLFGLVVYTTSQKYKEISIRKVLGANESSLVLQLGRGYVMLITLAFIVAIPLSYYAATRWLEKFPYRTELTWLLFVKAGLFILVISLITVGVQSLKAARTNPVNALKEQ